MLWDHFPLADPAPGGPGVPIDPGDSKKPSPFPDLPPDLPKKFTEGMTPHTLRDFDIDERTTPGWNNPGMFSPYGNFSAHDAEAAARAEQEKARLLGKGNVSTDKFWTQQLSRQPMPSAPESNATAPLPPPMANQFPETGQFPDIKKFDNRDRGWMGPGGGNPSVEGPPQSANPRAEQPNTADPRKLHQSNYPWLNPEATNVSATQGAQVNQSQSAQNAENAKVSKSHDLNWNAFPFAFPTFTDNQSTIAPSTDLSDLNEGLAASAMTRGGIPLSQMAVATGIRGIGRDYVQAIDDLNKGKVTEADREARIAESSKEANEYWGGIRQKVGDALSEGGGGVLGQLGQTQGVSALGMAGPLGESADLVRPPSLQNRVTNPQQQPVQTPQFNKNIPPPFQGENLPSDTAQPAPTYTRNKPAWKHFPLVG